MLKNRIIPVLLIDNGDLVKTINFGNKKYVGDPINAIRIFNEKSVDEIVVYDISADRFSRGPDLSLIKQMSGECRMPLSYGGGIRHLKDALNILALGVEKISICSRAFDSFDMITKLVQMVGKQSVAVTLDYKSVLLKGNIVFTNNGRNTTQMKLRSAMELFYELGVGELVLNSIDRDGTMNGMDTNLVKELVGINIPIMLVGGCGNLHHISEVSRLYKIIGIGCGSFFVFQGKFRSVLIRYLSQKEKEEL
jgi:cyclase